MGISVFDSEPLRWAAFKEKDPEKVKSICDEIYRHQLESARQRAERAADLGDLRVIALDGLRPFCPGPSPRDIARTPCLQLAELFPVAVKDSRQRGARGVL